MGHYQGYGFVTGARVCPAATLQHCGDKNIGSGCTPAL